MLIVVSPAKRLNENPVAKFELTEPMFQDQAEALAGVARGMSMGEIGKLMKISEKLSKLNYDRYRDFGKMERGAAALIFDGDTYAGLEAKSLEPDEMDWAAQHLRILSGMYGILRPTDAIEPHRMEMGSRLKNPRGKNLYEYWGSQIAEALNDQGALLGAHVLINCASEEYFGAVDRDALKLRVITPVFKEMRGGQPKIVSFFAKKARGSMARFIIQNRLQDPDEIKKFDMAGYDYQPDMSEGDSWVFLRDEGAED
ncbi:peroxide stress protein YaaA [Alisedimentitalea sp. MJ-SS2]|uniref:peroxide stress protein YaaA n=1 Tax=Aliisedimentitalea sp. MJ-SS2 TaxID=3049795 RepID=UPI00290C5956|nr:peroxide stress protein YaaA [Alisedimentitalea sp. MJ-SS2]MDU8929447.1 peroxide stress protein YaaA [Alisedimentitalea sp. MJ-SS2]